MNTRDGDLAKIETTFMFCIKNTVTICEYKTFELNYIQCDPQSQQRKRLIMEMSLTYLTCYNVMMTHVLFLESRPYRFHFWHKDRDRFVLVC